MTDNTVERVSVWTLATDALSQDEVVAMRAVLSADELTRCDAFVRAETRRDYVAAHALLRRALTDFSGGRGRPAEWTFARSEAGKPRLAEREGAERPLEFNLSHTRGFVACAVAAVPVGVDVEWVGSGRDTDGIAARYFHAAEREALAALGEGALREALFIELWTLKEAYLKGLGVGLAQHLDAIAFGVSEMGDAACVAAPAQCRPERWQFRLLQPRPGLRLALAVASSLPLAVDLRDDASNI